MSTLFIQVNSKLCGIANKQKEPAKKSVLLIILAAPTGWRGYRSNLGGTELTWN